MFQSRLVEALGKNASREQRSEDRKKLLSAKIDSERSMLAAIAAPHTPAAVLTIIGWLLGRWPAAYRRPEFVRAAAALLRHAQSDVRQEAAVSLGLLGTRRAAEVLRSAIRDRDQEVRKRIISGLGLQQDDKDAYEAVAAVLRDKKEASAVRAHAAEALANFAEVGSAEDLIQALSDPAPEVRFFAVHALGELRVDAAVPALRIVSRSDRALVPGFGTVRSEATRALLKITQGR